MPQMKRNKDKVATTQKAPHRKMTVRTPIGIYPVMEPFTSIAQVDEYLAGEYITCLLCGKKLKALATHLVKIHGIGADDYRLRYGIPWSYGLVPAISSDKIARAQKMRWDNGTSPLLGFQDGEARLKSHKIRPRKISEAVRKQRKERLESLESVVCRCPCGESFTRGPHSMTKSICDKCYRVRNPWRFIKSVEFLCDRCGEIYTKGPTSKRSRCPGCNKQAKQERKNVQRRTGRRRGRPSKRTEC